MKHTAIGLMSGTSLDGTDIAYCLFENKNSTWNFKIIQAQTIPYPPAWEKKLRQAHGLNGQELIRTHVEYGHYLGEITNNFIKEYRLNKPDLISSHGHTVFHQPGNRLTFQIGEGSAIAAQTERKVVCDFRSLNVACGGQGAPLVPIGDNLLFAEYDFCLNLGGFANISLKKYNKRVAFDICPVNYVINNLVKHRSREAHKLLYNDNVKREIYFDPDGKIAESGKKSSKLIDELNNIDYYNQKPPKSLGAEWVEENINPIVEKYSKLPLQDILRSFYEHIANQINNVTNSNKKKTMLVTGGGAYNKFLVNMLKNNHNVDICLPDKNIIEYKEALIFAFLGVLRINNVPNILKSASGGWKNNIGGGIFNGE